LTQNNVLLTFAYIQHARL